jgi:hypothetical protein
MLERMKISIKAMTELTMFLFTTKNSVNHPEWKTLSTRSKVSTMFLHVRLVRTRNMCLVLRAQDCPVNEGHNKGVCNRSSVENAEKGTVLGRWILTRRREEGLKTSTAGWDLATVMREVKVHPGPDLQKKSALKTTSSKRCTYQRYPGVENLEEVDNVGKFKDSEPAMMNDIDLIVDEHAETDEKVHSDDSTEDDQRLLANRDPWRVADAQEDGLRWSVTVQTQGGRLT